MQHSEKFVCLEYSEVELMIPQKDAFSAIFCDSSCFVKDKNGNGKTIFNSQWIPYIDLDKYSFSRNLAVIAQNPSCEDSFESVTKKSKKVKTCLIINNKTLFPDEKYYGLITSTDCKVKEFSLSSFSLFSDFYNEYLKKKGIIASKFNQKISYLLNIDDFLREILKNREGEK